MNQVETFALNNVLICRPVQTFEHYKLIKSANISKITSLKYAKVKQHFLCLNS